MEEKDDKNLKTLGLLRLPIYLAWKDLQFEVKEKDKSGRMYSKVILNKLNGHVKPGEFIGVIGPSGSGKSSFLNCIAGRIQTGLTGEILFNDVHRPSNVARFSGYVIQDDIYFESLTVRETLLFAAKLKLAATVTFQQRKERVEYILNELDLHKCADTRIGTIGKGISGGERRRLAIGLEIINEPSLLLLDEPTSGLDSASALMVGKILRRLATNKKMTILATIHQPRYSLATLFDKIYFLAKGNEMYFGPTVPDCLKFFENSGYSCPPYDNPADFLLDLVNTSSTSSLGGPIEEKNQQDTNGQDIEVVTKNGGLNSLTPTSSRPSYLLESRDVIITRIAKCYQESEFKKQALNYQVSQDIHGSMIFDKLSKDFYITNTFNQIVVVCHRSFIHKLREPIAMMTQAFNAIVIPLLFGTIYWALDTTQQGALDRVSAISLISLMLAFFAMDCLILFPSERSIFNREQASGMYRPISFYIGRTMSELPQHIILSFIEGVIAYWMFGLQNDASKFLTWSVIIILETICGAGLLLTFSACSKNLEQSNLLATLFILIFMLFDGNWISIDKIPHAWRWVQYISFIGYAGQALMANEYRGLEFTCTESEEENGSCYYKTGEDILYVRGIEKVDILFNIEMLIVLFFVYRFIAFLGVWLLHRNQSPIIIIKNTFKFD